MIEEEDVVDLDHVTKGRLMETVFAGNTSGVDAAVPQAFASRLWELKLDHRPWCMSYKGNESFGRLVNVMEAIAEMAYPVELKAALVGEANIPAEIDDWFRRQGVDPQYYVLRDEKITNVAEELLLERGIPRSLLRDN